MSYKRDLSWLTQIYFDNFTHKYMKMPLCQSQISKTEFQATDIEYKPCFLYGNYSVCFCPRKWYFSHFTSAKDWNSALKQVATTSRFVKNNPRISHNFSSWYRAATRSRKEAVYLRQWPHWSGQRLSKHFSDIGFVTSHTVHILSASPEGSLRRDRARSDGQLRQPYRFMGLLWAEGRSKTLHLQPRLH